MASSDRRSRVARGVALPAAYLFLLATSASSQIPDSLSPTGALKKLSLEQLLGVEVTSVSKHAEKLSAAASAVQVITAEDIRRSGATSLPEALRLAPNLQVAQVNASQWAISARGFDNVLANKLLVLIDGRTVYTPLYAGVFWDVQNPPLESVDRIEVISGPGGALWGANAVNGVINVVTKSAKDTQGWSLEGGGGSEARAFGDLRYGGRLAPDFYARAYAEGFERGSTALVGGGDPRDSWHMVQGGFRLDRNRGNDRVTLQADGYDGRPDPDGGAPVAARGANLLGRWSHTISAGSDFELQLYYDRTYRDFRNGFTEDLATYDADWQHHFRLGERQDVTWGLAARLMDHETQSLPLFAFEPAQRFLHLYSGFVQDEIGLVKERLRLTLGTKLERNDYTGWEIQPSARLAWTPTARHTVWAAVSRAVRTPARIDRDFFLFAAPGIPVIAGDSLVSEELLAYELGWRLEPSPSLSVSLSTFYNDYDNLRSAEPGPPPAGLPITLQNGVDGHAYGMELAATWRVSPGWRLRGGYTFLAKDLFIKPGSNDLNGGTAESDDPRHQFLIQSIADLPSGIQLDAVARYVGDLPNPPVSSYLGLDLRVGWRPGPRLELALVGQNLLQQSHGEFVPSSPAPREIQRGVYGKVTWRP